MSQKPDKSIKISEELYHSPTNIKRETKIE